MAKIYVYVYPNAQCVKDICIPLIFVYSCVCWNIHDDNSSSGNGTD